MRAAVACFYDALEAMMRGQGTALMEGGMAPDAARDGVAPHGGVVPWMGRDPRHMGHRRRPRRRRERRIVDLELHVHLYGDVAYTTCVFVAGPRFGSATMNCTNVLHRDGGVWKLVHHHADKSQKVERGLEAIAEG